MPTNIIRKPVPGAAQSVSLLPPSREPEDTNSFPPTSPSRGYTSQDSVNHIPSLTAHEVPNPSSGQSWEGEVPVVSASSYQPINDNQERKPDLTKYVKWGVDWYKEPTYMVLLLLAGLAIALGHHFYYKNLNGATAEDESRQQWARAIGNGLSFLFVSALRGADGFAYSQYFWVLVRRRSFTLDGLDKLYSLTSDPTGLFSLKLFRNATIAMAVALVCWFTPLAGVLPPGTLSVVPGLSNHTASTLFPTLNWNSEAWISGTFGSSTATRISTSELVLGLASQTAQGLKILEFQPPVLNSSYRLNIWGPFVRCQEANSTQLPLFQYYNNFVAQDSFMFIDSTWVNTSKTWGPFPPNGVADKTGFLGTRMVSLMAFELQDVFSHGGASDPERYLIGNLSRYLPSMRHSQLWVQTANDSVVCSLGNGSLTINFDFVDGTQNISYGDIEHWAPVLDDSFEPSKFDVQTAYTTVFDSLASMIRGNITTIVSWDSVNGSFKSDPKVQYSDITSNILTTGLDACIDFTKSVWVEHPIYSNTSGAGDLVENEYYENYTSIPIRLPDFKGAQDNIVFKKPSWMCRNATLARAVEDLAANITISMLTSLELTTPNSTTVEVFSSLTVNVYKYDPRYLIISYSLGLLFSILSVAIGIYSFRANGVNHSSAFSAIVATTRNPDLDALSRGQSLGVLSLDKDLVKVKIKFGELITEAHDIGEQAHTASHIAFGITERVARLRRGGEYI